jgi:hypothetical protein
MFFVSYSEVRERKREKKENKYIFFIMQKNETNALFS